MFLHILLNQDISLNILQNLLKFGIYVNSTNMEGTVSQISFYLGLGLYLMKSRKNICKKITKNVFRFLT